jgi:hypothetical protein
MCRALLREWPFRLEQLIQSWYKFDVSETEKYQNNAMTTAILMEAGIAMMQENLQRRHPTANPDRINTLLGDWLYRKDDPLPGDTAGQVRIRERAR